MKKHTITKDGYTNYATYTNEFKASVAFLHNVKGVPTSSLANFYIVSDSAVRNWSKIFAAYFSNEAQVDEKSKYGRLLTVITNQSGGECQKVYDDDKHLVLFCTAEKSNLQKSFETLGLKIASLDKVDFYKLKGSFIELNKKSPSFKKNFTSLENSPLQEQEKQETDYDTYKSKSCLSEADEGLEEPKTYDEERLETEIRELQEKYKENPSAENAKAIRDKKDELCKLLDSEMEEKLDVSQQENSSTESSIRIYKTDTGLQIEDKLYSIFCKIFAETSRVGFKIKDFELGSKCLFRNDDKLSSAIGDKYQVYYSDEGGNFHISGFITFIDCGNIWIIDDAGNNVSSAFFLFARNRMKLPWAKTYIYSNKTGNIFAIEKGNGIDDDVLFSSEFKIFSNGETNAAELMAREKETEQEIINCEKSDILEPFVPDLPEHHPVLSISDNASSKIISNIATLRALFAKNKIKIFKNNINIGNFGFSFMIQKGLHNLRCTSDKIYRILSDAGFEGATVELRYTYEYQKYFFEVYIPFDRETEINLPDNPFEL